MASESLRRRPASLPSSVAPQSTDHGAFSPDHALVSAQAELVLVLQHCHGSCQIALHGALLVLIRSGLGSINVASPDGASCTSEPLGCHHIAKPRAYHVVVKPHPLHPGPGGWQLLGCARPGMSFREATLQQACCPGYQLETPFVQQHALVASSVHLEKQLSV